VKALKDPEAWGAYTGIPGALLLAMNNGYSHYGWALFLASNISWIVFAMRGNYNKLLFQQMAFMATTLLGLWNTVIAHWIVR
jgi:hypothetical protein